MKIPAREQAFGLFARVHGAGALCVGFQMHRHVVGLGGRLAQNVVVGVAQKGQFAGAVLDVVGDQVNDHAFTLQPPGDLQ